MFLRNARPIIQYAYINAVIAPGAGDADTPLLFSVFTGIFHQVKENAIQQRRICGDGQLAANHRTAHIPFVQLRRQLALDGLHQRLQHHVLVRVVPWVAISCQYQEAVYNLCEPVNAVQELPSVLLIVPQRSRSVREQHLNPSLHDGKRCLQFMGRIGCKAALALEGVLQPGHHTVETVG